MKTKKFKTYKGMSTFLTRLTALGSTYTWYRDDHFYVVRY